MLMNYAYTLDSVFKLFPPKTQNWLNNNNNKTDLTNQYVLLMQMFS